MSGKIIGRSELLPLKISGSESGYHRGWCWRRQQKVKKNLGHFFKLFFSKKKQKNDCFLREHHVMRK